MMSTMIMVVTDIEVLKRQSNVKCEPPNIRTLLIRTRIAQELNPPEAVV